VQVQVALQRRSSLVSVVIGMLLVC